MILSAQSIRKRVRLERFNFGRQPYSGRYQNQPSRPVAAIMEPGK